MKPTSEILDRFKKLGGQLDATLRYYGITDNPAGLTNKKAKRVLGLVDSGRTGRTGKRFSGNQKNNSEYPSTPLRRTEELESKLLFQDAYHGSATILPPLPKTEGRTTKDQIFRVKTTIKRFIDKNSNSKAYAYSVEKIEILPGTLDNANSTIPKGNTSINADNLLFNVHKVNKRDGTEGPIALNDIGVLK